MAKIEKKKNKIETKINYGKLKNLVKAMAQKYTVKLGLLAEKGGGEQVSPDFDLAALGATMEYGADIKITDKMRKFLGAKAKELGLKTTGGGKSSDGNIHIPARSFLYAPIVLDSKGFRKKIFNQIDEAGMGYVAEYGDFEFLAQSIAIAGFEQVQEAFRNGGIFGEWAPNSPYTIAQKGSSSPLIDTGRLRGAIAYEIEKK